MHMNQNRESYDQISGTWDAWRRQRPVNTCIREVAGKIRPGGRVLDIGCGAGQPIASFLVHEGFAVTGIDLSPRMIEKAKGLNLPGAEFLCVDFLDYETEQTFDGLIAFDSLWHIAHKDQPAIYPRLAKLAAPGCRLLFTAGRTEGEVQGEMFGQPFFYGALEADTIRALLEENGFIIEQFLTDYAEETTGTRDLLVVARKK